MKTFLKLFSVILYLMTTVVACNEDDDIPPQNTLVAVAGENKSTPVNAEILLDGSASYDKSNKPFAYLWSIKIRPQGSAAVLQLSNSTKPKFTPDVAGTYTIQLQISRENWSAKDELVITATSNDPNGPVAVTLQDDITVNTTLADIFEDPEQADYIVTKDIAVRADLVIMPGVTIAFQENKGLEVIQGSIQALGTESRRIIFRGSGNGGGYWKGILIHTNSDLNKFDYTTVQQGGSSVFAGAGVQANVTLAGTPFSGAALKISHTTFGGSGGYGLYVQGQSLLKHFFGNTFVNNVTAAAYIPAGQLHAIDAESFSGNGRLETGGIVAEDQEVTWKYLPNISYTVNQDIEIKSGIRIDPGASFKMKAGVTIRVVDNGYLNATGSGTLPIAFRSTANNVYWNGLYFNSANSNNKLKYCHVTSAGMNVIGGAAQNGNVVIGLDGVLTIENSLINNGLGYGLVMHATNQVNQNVAEVNTFQNLQKGAIFPQMIDPNAPPLTGTWLDAWSFGRGVTDIADSFYDVQAAVWFAGAANPWAMTAAGFGIRFEADGGFIWTVAEHSPIIGCESYSAEYMTGNVSATSSTISFDQEHWRSKFINSCDASQNVDTWVTPSLVELPYTIVKRFKASTNEVFWELKFTNPDGSTFSYFRK